MSRYHENLKVGLVQVYTGDGKGKTTAALGVALRAAGHHYRTLVVQFMKGSSYIGELFSVQRHYPYITILQFGRDCRNAPLIRQGMMECRNCGECFVRKGGETPEDRLGARLAFQTALEAIEGDKYDIVILDEISQAIDYGFIQVSDVLKLIKTKPADMELVLTGRNMPPEIIDEAHLVTEMRLVKHPFQEGVPARRGIEY